MKKQIIAIDLDDTLAETSQAIVRHVSKKMGVSLHQGDISSSEFWAKYGITDSQAIELVHGYVHGGCPSLVPIVGALEVCWRLAKQYDLCVITAREPESEDHTKIWLENHFNGVFTQIILSGNPYVNPAARSKAEVCQEIGAQYMIDDSVSTLKACADVGLKTLLFGDHRSRDYKSLHPQITRVKDWSQVGDYFVASSR